MFVLALIGVACAAGACDPGPGTGEPATGSVVLPVTVTDRTASDPATLPLTIAP
jgi:hypothetical protein